MTTLTYSQAIKTPSGGWTAAAPVNMRAAMAQMIGGRHCIRPEAVYNWAQKFDIPIEKRGAYFMNIANNSDLLEDILNDQFKETNL